MIVDILTKYYGVDILAIAMTFIGLYLIGNRHSLGFVIAAIGNTL